MWLLEEELVDSSDLPDDFESDAGEETDQASQGHNINEADRAPANSGLQNIVQETVPSPVCEAPLSLPVPKVAGDDTCSVGILLPDGTRIHRLFFKHDIVKVCV